MNVVDGQAIGLTPTAQKYRKKKDHGCSTLYIYSKQKKKSSSNSIIVQLQYKLLDKMSFFRQKNRCTYCIKKLSNIQARFTYRSHAAHSRGPMRAGSQI